MIHSSVAVTYLTYITAGSMIVLYIKLKNLKLFVRFFLVPFLFFFPCHHILSSFYYTMQREFFPSQPQFVWHPQAPAELCERINCWRQQVEVCSPTRSPSPSQLQNIRRESLTSQSSTPRATRRHKPYSRTRFRESTHTDLSDFHVTGLNTGLEELNQYGLHRETMRVLPRVLDERCEASCRTPTIRDFRGMDLPHPEHNPLVR